MGEFFPQFLLNILFAYSRRCTKSLQSYLTLCDPMDYNLPGSSVHGILRARILKWKKKKKNTEVGFHFLLQGIFPTQGSSLHLLSLLHRQVGSLPLAPPGKPYNRRMLCKRTTQIFKSFFNISISNSS